MGFKNWNKTSLSMFRWSMQLAGQCKQAIHSIYSTASWAILPVSIVPHYAWQRENRSVGQWSGERDSWCWSGCLRNCCNCARTCTCQIASGTVPRSRRDKKDGADWTPGWLTTERILARGMTMLVVVMMAESSNENDTSPNSSLTNQPGLMLLHPSNRPNRIPVMKSQGSGESFIRPASCTWLYHGNGEDGKNRGPAEKW